MAFKKYHEPIKLLNFLSKAFLSAAVFLSASESHFPLFNKVKSVSRFFIELNREFLKYFQCKNFEQEQKCHCSSQLVFFHAHNLALLILVLRLANFLNHREVTLKLIVILPMMTTALVY